MNDGQQSLALNIINFLKVQPGTEGRREGKECEKDIRYREEVLDGKASAS